MARSTSIIGLRLAVAAGVVLFACRSGESPFHEPGFTGGDCGTIPFEGRCQLTVARVGPHPEASGNVIVDTNWQPEDAGAGRQYFTCGPAFAVAAEKGESLRRHIKANSLRACKGTFAIGSCNPCPVGAMEVDLPPFEETPLVPIANSLVRF